jgi:hypothetical protein
MYSSPKRSSKLSAEPVRKFVLAPIFLIVYSFQITGPNTHYLHFILERHLGIKLVSQFTFTMGP